MEKDFENAQQDVREKIEEKELFDNSLDESTCDSLLRDLKSVGLKFRCALIPKFEPGELAPELRNWDLWGPILLSMFLGLIMSFNNAATADNFGIIFLTIIIGTFIITFNFKILGSKLRFFQTVSFLGYCITPLAVAVIVLLLLRAASVKFLVINLLVMGLACVWSLLSSYGFLSTMIAPDKKIISMYPVFLFYALLSSYMIYI